MSPPPTSPVLLKQGNGQEGEDIVLGGGDFVTSIALVLRRATIDVDLPCAWLSFSPSPAATATREPRAHGCTSSHGVAGLLKRRAGYMLALVVE